MTKAQDMIQKGIETGDMELVKQGYALLEKKPKKTAKKTVKKKAPVKKRGRPTKKQLTQPVDEDILTEEPHKDPNDFSFQIRQRKTQNDKGDGRRVPRVEQVDLSNRVNEFVDDNKLVPVRDIEKKLYIHPPVPRREEADIRLTPCSECDNEFYVNIKKTKKKNFVCDECLKSHAEKLKDGRRRGLR